MSKKTIQLSFFAVVMAVVVVLLFFIFKPYLGVMFISGIIAVTFYPMYEKLLEKFKGRKKLASITSTLLILVFVIVPLIIICTLLINEAVGLYNFVALDGGSSGFVYKLNTLFSRVNSLLPIGVSNTQVDLGSYARNILDWVIGHFGSVFSAVFGGVFNFILMMISLFYMFMSGSWVKKSLISWSPLPDKYDEEFISTLRSSIETSLRGLVLIAIIHGFFIGLSFVIFGVGSPVLWGFIGGIASLVPMLGVSIVVVPAIVYLFINGSVSAAIGLLIWSVVTTSFVDQFISVAFMKHKMKIHPLIILFSILGGIEVFGAIGFFLGPVVVSAFIALLKIYPSIGFYKEQET